MSEIEDELTPRVITSSSQPKLKSNWNGKEEQSGTQEENCTAATTSEQRYLERAGEKLQKRLAIAAEEAASQNNRLSH